MSVVALVRADFNERTRRFGFFVFLLATLGMGWLGYAGHTQMGIGGQRGVLNSAWIGTTMAISAGVFITMIGFYYVKNALEHDRKSGVGELVCATRLGSIRYLFSKWASNSLILSSVLALLAIASGVVQLLSAENTEVDLLALLSPMVMLGLPAVCVVAALAVIFETIPFLRGGFGNVFYFFLWGIAFALSAEAKIGALDWLGFSFVETALVDAFHAATGAEAAGVSFTIGAGALLVKGVNESFVWEGIRWSSGMAAMRLVPVAIAGTFVALSALWFDRFDPSRGKRGRGATNEPDDRETEAKGWEKAAATLGEVRITGRGQLVAMTFAELRVMLAMANKFWLLGAAVMAGLLLVTPGSAPRAILIPAMLWPVLFWSGLGMRERWHGTDQILFSTPHPIRNQMIASWLAGVALACLTTGTWGLRTLVTGELVGFSHWLAGALFVPALALCLGVWSGTSRLFESLYVGLWYVGIANATPELDFIGVSLANSTPERVAMVGGAAIVLVALAALGRKRQLEE